MAEVLVDADSLIYPLGFVAQSGGWDLDHTLNALDNKWDEIKKNVYISSKPHFFFTGSGPVKYRDQFQTIVPYKQNRKDSTKPKPLYIPEMISHCMNNFNVSGMSGVVDCTWGEADDARAAAANHFYQGLNSVYIVGVDKDLLQIPATHYNHKKNSFNFVSEALACKTFYAQMLIGDSADNIKGVKGIGMRKASKILSTYISESDMYDRVVTEYESWLTPLGHDLESISRTIHETGNLLYLRKGTTDYWKPGESFPH